MFKIENNKISGKCRCNKMSDECKNTNDILDNILEMIMIDIKNVQDFINLQNFVSGKILSIQNNIEKLIYMKERNFIGILENNNQEDTSEETRGSDLFTKAQEEYILKLVTDHLNNETQKVFNSLPEDVKRNYMEARKKI